VRKAEQGTRPKVFYLGADAATLTPELQSTSESYLWAERPREEVDLMKMVAAVQERGPGDAALSRPVYDAPHAVRPWGWKVSTYLWTKSISAGALLVAAFAGSESWGSLFDGVAPALSLLFLALTTALLVADLKRPDRFAFILLKPNWRSWLVWGAWILMAFGAAGAGWFVAGATGRSDLLHLTLVPSMLLALATAGYSAFLFGQAEGRDFWQSPLVLPHLIIAAVLAGAATLSIAAAATPLQNAEADPSATLWPLLFLSLVAHGFLIGLEVLNRHAVHDATLAARLIRRGPYRVRFWGGAVLGGVFLPMTLMIAGAAADSTALSALGAVLALAGLWVWEDLWVKAGQSVPLS
jgi:formate-dependent nitrite reductase membrane component NrfD